MNSRTFFYLSLLLGIGLFATFAVINFYIDIYGIHQSYQFKNKKVYFNEEYSKYLLSKNYVPMNFNGIFIGPSLSDNIDTEKFEFLDVYNLSFMGARMSDLEVLTRSAVSRENSKIKSVILCLNPYLTEINSNLVSDLSVYAYKESFGSYNLIKTYLIASIRYFDLMPYKYPKNQFSSYGYNNYNALFEVDSVINHIRKKAQEQKAKKIQYEEKALSKLNEIINYLEKNEISLFVYFHPIPRDIYLAGLGDYINYKKAVLNSIESGINYIDLNSDEFVYFTKDYSNYIDHGHLSFEGQSELVRILERHLSKQNVFSN